MDEARNPELEAAILAAPDDPVGYAVYGDWLAEQGDPRGELIAIQLAAETRPALRAQALAVFARHRTRFLGALGDQLVGGALDWRYGFIHRARLSYDDVPFIDGARVATPLPAIAAALLAHPSARLLAELRIDDDAAAVVDQLVTRPPRALRALSVGLGARPQKLRTLALLWPRLPRLQRLAIAGRYSLGPISLPALTHAELTGWIASRADATDIATAHWPRLESLRLHVTTSPGTAPLAEIASRPDLPALTSLALISDQPVPRLVELLISGPVLPRLHTLEIMLDRLALAQIESAAHAFRHVALHVVQAKRLARSQLDRLRRIFREVVTAT